MTEPTEIEVKIEPNDVVQTTDTGIITLELLDAKLGELRAELENRFQAYDHDRERGDWFSEERYHRDTEDLKGYIDSEIEDLKDEMHILFAYVVEEDGEEEETIIEEAPPPVEIKEEKEKPKMNLKEIVRWED